MKTFLEIQSILADIQYLDWTIKFSLDGDSYIDGDGYIVGRTYLQVLGHGPNPKNNMEDEQWSSRKWFVSPHMCMNEIVRTAYKAIDCAVQHEMNEMFLYKGQAVFTPHLDYDTIAEMMETQNMSNSRENGMQGV